MQEKIIEQKLVVSVKARDGICPKWVSPGLAGVPDRLVFLPHGKFGLVEVKQRGKKPRTLQVSRHKLFGKLGFKVYVLDDLSQIGDILDEIETT